MLSTTLKPSTIFICEVFLVCKKKQNDVAWMLKINAKPHDMMKMKQKKEEEEETITKLLGITFIQF